MGFFFIIQRLKARAIPCPHQPPTRGDNTVSVAQGGTVTPGATKQLLPPDRVLRELYIYIYIYMPDQLRAETTLDVNLHFQCAVCDLKKQTKKNAFTFGGWCYYAFTVTVFYVITRERWFRVYFVHAENVSLLTKSNLMHIAPRSEDDLRQLSNYFWKKRNDWVSYKTTTTNLNRNHIAYPTFFHAVGTECLVAVFLPLVCFLPIFFPGDSQFYEEDTLLWIGPCYNVRPLFCLNNVNWKL